MGQDAASDPDVELMLAVQADRPGAFERLVARFSHELHAFAHRQLGRRDAAEDTVQDLFLRVFRSRAAYRPTAPLRPWLMKIAANLCLNWKRRESYRDHRPLPDGGAEDLRESAGADAPIERDEVAARVRQALDALPASQRMAVVLLRFEGLGYREIGAVMGLSLPAVKSLLNRAKEALRGRLARDVKDLALTGSPDPVGEQR